MSGSADRGRPRTRRRLMLAGRCTPGLRFRDGQRTGPARCCSAAVQVHAMPRQTSNLRRYITICLAPRRTAALARRCFTAPVASGAAAGGLDFAAAFGWFFTPRRRAPAPARRRPAHVILLGIDSCAAMKPLRLVAPARDRASTPSCARNALHRRDDAAGAYMIVVAIIGIPDAAIDLLPGVTRRHTIRAQV